MRNSTVTTCLLALLALAGGSAFGTTAASVPVGFTRQRIEPGRQTVGVTLNGAVVCSALVAASDASSVRLDPAVGSVADRLDPAGAYYAEIAAGTLDTLAGDRFEIDVAATRAAGGATVILEPADHNSTALPLPTDALAGHRLLIRRHLTLGSVFGGGALHGLEAAPRYERADQIYLFDRRSGAFSIYFLCDEGAGAGATWRRVGSFGRMDDVVIPPGTGVFLLRQGAAPLDFVVLGHVRANDFVMPLAQGYNFVASPFPVEGSPHRLQMTCANGFAAASAAGDADQILVYNGAGFDTYFLGRPDPEAREDWRKLGDEAGDATYGSAQLLASSNSVFIRKVGPDPDFVARRSYGL